jgi:D-amino-acid dehydrogenase
VVSRIVVIGGGIVGIACALELLDDGHAVTVLEPGTPGEGASWASCGSIAVSEVVPLSKPGTFARIPGWMLDPLGPLTLRPSSLLPILPWFARFAANARPARVEAIARELSVLGLAALDDTERLLARHGLKGLLGSRPVIELYDRREELAHERRFHDLRRSLGFVIDEISGAEAREMEPGIAGDFACATVFRDWRSVVDPKRLVAQMHRAFRERGGIVLPVGATTIVRDSGAVTGVRTAAGETLHADTIILAAGAASRDFARGLGAALPIEGVIGYQTSLTDPGIEVNHALVYAKGGFGITPYDSGLAVAGSIEFARIDAAPNWNRADVLVQKARRVLPGLRTERAERRRPLTPDTKPVIGRLPTAREVICATGHGQLGVTLAATTAQHVRDLVAGRRPNVDLSPFAPDRFGRAA